MVQRRTRHFRAAAPGAFCKVCRPARRRTSGQTGGGLMETEGALDTASRLPLLAQTGRGLGSGDLNWKYWHLLTPTLSSRGGGEGETRGRVKMRPGKRCKVSCLGATHQKTLKPK